MIWYEHNFWTEFSETYGSKSHKFWFILSYLYQILLRYLIYLKSQFELGGLKRIDVSLTNLSSQESQHPRKVSKLARRKIFSKFLERNTPNKLTKIKIKLYLKNRINRKKNYQKRLETTTPNGNIKITTVTTTQLTTTAKYYRIYQSKFIIYIIHQKEIIIKYFIIINI